MNDIEVMRSWMLISAIASLFGGTWMMYYGGQRHDAASSLLGILTGIGGLFMLYVLIATIN